MHDERVVDVDEEGEALGTREGVRIEVDRLSERMMRRLRECGTER